MAVILAVVRVSYGYGQHSSFLNHEQSRKQGILHTPAIVAILISVALAKTSICLLIIRILGNTVKKWHNAFLYTVTGTVWLSILVYVLGFFVFCRPIGKGKSHDGQCVKPTTDLHVVYAQIGRISLVCIAKD